MSSIAHATAPVDDVIDAREQHLFRSLDIDNDEHVLRSELFARIADAGLHPSDRRLGASMSALERFLAEVEEPAEEAPETPIPKARFCRAIRPNIHLIERALQGRMVIPDFAGFRAEFDRIFEATKANRAGKPADYIPQLDVAGPDADRFGAAVCTIDGQHHAVGDSDRFFSLQSSCKTILYCLALEEHGAEVVHRHIGHEPSGASFNELTLDKQNRPHNPMINAGAILSCALIKPRTDSASAGDLSTRGHAGERFDYVMDRWQALSGGERPRFNTAVFLSERETADRNFALAYYMREKGAFPDGAPLEDVLEFYFQCCSIELNAEMMAVVAATLANGGVCPLTGERVFNTGTVQRCLSMMSACGMYDYSGAFAFSVGLPAKSGVSGVVMVVVPNVMGFCVWSPRLDEIGNSVRGLEFCRRLVDVYNIHGYDNLTGTSAKKDLRLSPLQVRATTINEFIWAASKGDLGAIHGQRLRGASLDCADYDGRTPLHLAAAENQLHVVEFFVAEKQAGNTTVDLDARDRWGGTPLDDAFAHGHEQIIAALETAGAKRGSSRSSHDRADGVSRVGAACGHASPMRASRQTAELIWAASRGDLPAIRRLVAQGVPLDVADYDRRTPLHLAASEGHDTVVDYLLAQSVPPDPRDRWGNTPLDDARREGRRRASDRLTPSHEVARSAPLAYGDDRGGDDGARVNAAGASKRTLLRTG